MINVKSNAGPNDLLICYHLARSAWTPGPACNIFCSVQNWSLNLSFCKTLFFIQKKSCCKCKILGIHFLRHSAAQWKAGNWQLQQKGFHIYPAWLLQLPQVFQSKKRSRCFANFALHSMKQISNVYSHLGFKGMFICALEVWGGGAALCDCIVELKLQDPL